MAETPTDAAAPFDYERLRIDYARGQLDEAHAAADPVEQFKSWFAEAEAAAVSPSPTR